MKKVFLIIAIALFSLNTFAQQKINVDDLIGYWKPNEELSELFFWKNTEGKLQTQEISSTSGRQIDLVELKVNTDSIFIKTIFVPNNWVTENTYIFIDANTLKRITTGDGQGVTIYKKVK
jgi:hypothetical protein